jgi:hypothetical protein
MLSPRSTPGGVRKRAEARKSGTVQGVDRICDELGYDLMP